MDYLTFILSRSLWESWAVFLLALSRIVTAIAMAPFFGARLLPASIKIGFGIAVSFLFFPFLIMQSHATYAFDAFFAFLMLKEVWVGFLLGFVISIPFNAVQSAGDLIDHQRGASSLQVMNPEMGAQTSPLGKLHHDMLIIIFFSLGGPLLFFHGLLASYELLPIDHFLPSLFFFT